MTNTEKAMEALQEATHAVVRPYSRVSLMKHRAADGTEMPTVIWTSVDEKVVRLMERFIKKKMSLWKDVGTSRSWLYAHMVAMPDDYYVTTFSTTWSFIWRGRMMEDPKLFDADNYIASRLEFEGGSNDR